MRGKKYIQFAGIHWCLLRKPEALFRKIVSTESQILSAIFILIITEHSNANRGLLGWEIEQCIKTYKLPIIVAYTMCSGKLTSISSYKKYWPEKLKEFIDKDKVKTIHIPLKKELILKAINDFSVNDMPNYTITVYKESVYDELLK